MSQTSIYDERELFKLIADGDESAFTKLFDHYYTSLVYFATRIIESRQEAEDIVLKIFFKLWENHSQHETSVFNKNFLYISVKNSCIDFLRSRQRMLKVQQNLLHNSDIDDNSLQARIVEADLINIIINRAEMLPPRYRDILFMIYKQHLTNQEIASCLNISQDAVRMQKKRALDMLRQSLAGHTLLPFILNFIDR